MDKDFIHPSLGFFIERTRKQSGVTIETLCKDLHISPSTYMDLKKKGVMPHLVHTKLFYDTISMNWRNWMMTKSGNWPASGWRNGFKRENQGNRFIVPLKTEGYDPYIDYLKGVSIFFVVLAHCLPMQNCLLFSFWGAQAVPLFLQKYL